MFVREKQVKGHGYYQVVQNQRSNGQVVQRLIKYLGKYPDKAAAIQAAVQLGYPIGHHGQSAEEKGAARDAAIQHIEAKSKKTKAPARRTKFGKSIDASAKAKARTREEAARSLERIEELDTKYRAVLERGENSKRRKELQAEVEEAVEVYQRHMMMLVTHDPDYSEEAKQAAYKEARAKERKLNAHISDTRYRANKHRKEAMGLFHRLPPAPRTERKAAEEYQVIYDGRKAERDELNTMRIREEAEREREGY